MASTYQLIRNGKPARRRDGSYIWCVDYKDAKGRRATKSTFRTKKEAENWKAETLTDIKKGIHIPDRDSVTVAEACELWLSVSRSRVERATLKQYGEHVRLYIVPHLGHMKLSQLDRGIVLDFVELVRERQSEAMARKVLTSLKSVLNTAMDYGRVAQSVAQGVKIKSTVRKREEVVIPTQDEVKRLLGACVDSHPDRHPLLVTAVSTGMRLSELRGLRWSDVDFDDSVIHVRRRTDAWGQDGDPKTAKSARTIHLGDTTAQVLREWKMRQPPEQRGQDRVFPNGRGKPENASNLYQRFLHPLQKAAEVVDEAGEPKYGWHAFRHFYASVMIAHGQSVVDVQQALGHASPTITLDVYSHQFQARDRNHDFGNVVERAIFD